MGSKSISILFLILILNTNVFVNAKDNKFLNLSKNNNKKEFNNLFELSENRLYSEKKENIDQSDDTNIIKRIKFKTIGIAGSTIFGLSIFSYMVSAVSIGASLIATLGTGSYLGPMAGIISSGIIPIGGPWIGMGLLIYMANTPSMVPENYKGNPYGYYGGLIALCSILGTFELTGFILMLIGFIGYNNSILETKKLENISLFITNDFKGSINTGIKLKL